LVQCLSETLPALKINAAAAKKKKGELVALPLRV
jgi:hypothetical protein